jgi:site-specific recombinase XerD
MFGSVDWGDPALKRWLGTIARESTKYVYRSAFKAYAQFSGLSASALIDEALEDAKRDPREKQDVVLTHLVEFYNWLKKEYPRRSRGRGRTEIVGKGVSDKLAHTYIGAIRSFYATYDVTVRMRGRRRLPKPKVVNKRMLVSAEDVKILVDHARTPRDRAIILTMFQSGMDVSTMCSLKYGDVADGLAKNDHPQKLELHRPKTGTEYYSFLGRDAVEALNAYLADAKARGAEFRSDSPLFLKERGDGGLTTNLVQYMMREVAVSSGFVDKENNGNSLNPLSPHALRESFGSIMINSGVPDTIVDFWLGHEIGEMAEAYKGVQYESLKQMFLEREKLMSISMSKVDVEELKTKLRGEIEQQTMRLQTIVNRVVSENLDLRQRIVRTEKKLSELENNIHEILELPARM